MTYSTLEEATNSLLKQYGVATEEELITSVGADKANLLLGSIAPSGSGFAINGTKVDSTNSVPTAGTVQGLDTNRYNTQGLQLQQADSLKNYLNVTNDPNYNSITGTNDLLSTKGLLGDRYSTGALKPALAVGQGAYNAYAAYQGIQETKNNNDRNYKLALENQRRGAISYNNKVAEKKRYAGLLTGNSNSYAGTVGTIAATPYSRY